MYAQRVQVKEGVGGGMYVWNVQESSEALVVTVASDKDNNNFCRDVFSLLALSF